jgi:hypothetical protein
MDGRTPELCLAETVDEECARIRCRLRRGHAGLHDDGGGHTWRGPQGE